MKYVKKQAQLLQKTKSRCDGKGVREDVCVCVCVGVCVHVCVCVGVIAVKVMYMHERGAWGWGPDPQEWHRNPYLVEGCVHADILSIPPPELTKECEQLKASGSSQLPSLQGNEVMMMMFLLLFVVQ